MAISWLLVGSGSEDPAAGLQPLVLREVRRGVLVGVWAHPLARRHANFFGKGVYFARDASYSTYPLYCEPDAKGSQTVFLVRVVTGEFCKGVKNALTPDLRNAAKNQLYDSTVDNVRDPSIFVTYHDAQAYPEYCIKFTQKKSSVPKEHPAANKPAHRLYRRNLVLDVD